MKDVHSGRVHQVSCQHGRQPQRGRVPENLEKFLIVYDFTTLVNLLRIKFLASHNILNFGNR